MPTFSYEAMNSVGQPVKGTVDAKNSEEAISKVRTMGNFPTKIKEKMKGPTGSPTDSINRYLPHQAKAKTRSLRPFYGICIVLAGVGLGLYCGVWWCFIGGIVQVVEAIKASPVSALGIALGLLRFCCSTVVGWGTFFIMAGYGVHVATKK